MMTLKSRGRFFCTSRCAICNLCEAKMQQASKPKETKPRRDESSMSPLGKYVMLKLRERHQTQAWLAEQVSMDRSSITRLMYGDHLLTHNVLIALADALGVDAAEVLRVAGGSRVGEVTGRVAYIANELQQLVDEAPEERGAEILDAFEAMVRLLRGK